jgi:polyhydroxyalkanoate synthase
MSAPPNSLADMLQSAAAMQESGRAVLRTMLGMGEVEVGTSEKHCVYSEDRIRLYRYSALTRSANLKPVLICYAMVNRPYLLDLQPDRSFIRELLLSGLDVYLLDWGYPDGADRFLGLNAYIDGYLRSHCSGFVRAGR